MSATVTSRSDPGRRVLYGSELFGEIAEFLHGEAEALDELRFDDWAEMLAKDLRYTVPVRVTRSFADRHRTVARGIMHFDDDYLSIMARIGRLSTTSAWAEDPPSRTRRLITNIRVLATVNPEEFAVKSYLLLSRSRNEDPDLMFLSGVRNDTLRRVEGDFKLAARDVLIDQAVLGMPNLAVFL